MKRPMILLLALTLLLALAGCALPGTGDPAARAIRKALQGEKDILCQGNSETARRLDIDAVPGYFSPGSDTARVWRFAPIDLDGDGETEVILQVIDAAGDMGGFLILHLDGKTVQGHYKGYRWFQELKADGTFGYTDAPGAGWGIGGVRFEDRGNDVCVTDTLLWQEEAAGEPVAWYAGGEPVEPVAFEEALASQRAKADALWYDFTPEGLGEGLPG